MAMGRRQRRRKKVVFPLLALVSLSHFKCCNGIDSQEGISDETSSSQCSVYLADSSIENAGYGVFAGKGFKAGDKIGSPSPGIQLIDVDDDIFTDELLWEYRSNPVHVGGDSEAEYVHTLLPGLSMMVNSHPILPNVLHGGLSERPVNKNPAGKGATTNPIEPGQEIFTDYSTSWFADKNFDDDENNSVPKQPDYDYVDQLVKKLVEFHNKHDLSEAAFQNVVFRVKNEMIPSGAGGDRRKKLIPDTIEELEKVADIGIARAQLNERSIDWLEQNGKCLDNLRAGVSTIPGAGRGAFATRPIKKGSVIVPSPLVHINNKKLLEMEDSDQKQLLLNYCFGHHKSDILLCPTTFAALINHSSSNKKSNSEYKWSKPSKNISQKENFLTKSLLHLTKHKSSSNINDFNTLLGFDIIATRDIEEGEEVFFDYGEEWETAWKEHVKKFHSTTTTTKKKREFIPASILNEKYPEIKVSSTIQNESYSYLCELEPFARDGDLSFLKDGPPEEDYNANPSLNRDTWSDATKLLYLDNPFLWFWPCEVLSDDSEDNSLFTVKVFQRVPEDDENRSPIRLLINYPRKAIKLVDKQYHSDQHLANSFRHYIPIRDEIFPLHWRKDYLSAKKAKLGVKNKGEHLSKAASEKLKEEFIQELREAKCGVYTAESTIPMAGKGMYVSVTIPTENIDSGPRIPILPVPDFSGENWDAFDYTWAPGAYNTEFEAENVQVLTTNEGCMANFHPGLVNMGMNDATYKPLLDRTKDPGAGAFSDYRDYSFKSQHKLEAGDEIFISYGESWFDHRPYLTGVPRSINYKGANSIVASVHGLTFGEEPALDTEEQVSDLLAIARDGIVLHQRTKTIINTIQTLNDVKRIVAVNGTAEATSEKRSLEWLEENGQCLDHIYVKESGIDQAGMGAFARRPIKKGHLIIPSPMLNSWGRDIFDISKKDIPKHLQDVNKKQLVYNYQWAHPDSSLLLFPTNTAITINHASDRRTNKKKKSGGPKPNAKLRWSTTDKKSMYFLQKPLEDLKKENYATVVLDYIATRDIEPDEEILIDYGEEWENAWEEHVKNFCSSCPSNETGTSKGKGQGPCFESSHSIYMMNEDKFNPSYFSWTKNHFTVCSYEEKPEGLDGITTLLPWKQGDTKSRKGRTLPNWKSKYNYKFSLHGITYDHEGFELSSNADSAYPCLILDADKEEGVFDVVYFTYEEPPEYNDGSILRRVHTLDEKDIRYINKPYTSDMHWKGAFRHEMKIPDSIFPPLWKDLLSS